MSESILVIVEHADGKVRRGSYETLGLARRIAEPAGARVAAVVLGSDTASLASEVASRGADVTYAVEHAQLGTFTPDAYRPPLVELIRETTPEWVLMAHTYLAQDLLPLVAASFGAPILSDCVDAEVDGFAVTFLRQPYDAKFVARMVDRGAAPRFATLQSGAFPAEGLPEGHGGEIVTRETGLSEDGLRRRVVETRSTGGGTVDLGAAEIVVAGGRGLQDKEKFEEIVCGLADLLGAGVGASRPVVDSDWLPHEHQIGSSGQIVAPRLYIALGISGAIQHVVGIRGAQVIVAINKDKDAPIFNEATYGIVGDVFEVGPELIKAIEEARQG
ncbi:MAG: electron transfer flavoprotein subunit alpha/FixB family protein [Acidobacteriota bacterium]|nr:electron transfer flavoprotein subunit alpha/FixB family protein [Acidobacteriota bacterium]